MTLSAHENPLDDLEGIAIPAASRQSLTEKIQALFADMTAAQAEARVANEKLVHAKATEDRLQQQIAALLALAKCEAIDRGELQAALAEITEAATTALDTERSSVWVYNEDATGIVCLDLYEKSRHAHSDGLFLKATDFPAYFDYLREQRTLAANDAHRDPATHEFSTVYLKPLGINSMLDAPIRLGGRMVGVLCNEHVGPARTWSLDDQYFAGNLADMISRAMQSAERKKTEEANQRLQHLDRLKSDFLSSVSHELRTPLTSIRGFASLVEREFSRSFATLAGTDAALEKKSRRIRDNLAIILKESERLTRLINDVLDLAKIEAGRIEWHDTRIEPANLVQDAAHAVHGMFDLKPAVALRLDIQPDLPPCIGDADKLLQVLVNLLNNAVKFTDHGTVTIKARSTPDNFLQIEIHDTGIGFPPEDAEAIFDKFQQSKHGDTLVDRPKGTGLGLAICREIINRHSGQIWAQSQPGQGSVFAFTLPLATAAGLAAAVPPAPTFTKVAPATPDINEPNEDKENENANKVLVVDDDPGVRDYLTQLLRESGYRVITAADGQAALAAAKAHRPDLITMDLAMPVMDGYSAMVKLRADRELQHIPIIVISAVPGWETAGGDLSMGKPIDEQRFLGNTRLLLGRAPGATPRSVRFLMLHETNQTPATAPASFTAQCEIENCPLDALPARLQAGFRGMVVVPNSLLDKVDLGLLQATPHLEIMIMPQQILPASKTPGQED